MKTVLVYKESLLNPSETFVAEQAGALTRYRAQFLALSRPERCLAFKGEPIYLNGGRQGAWPHFRVRLYRRTYFAPLFHRRVRRVNAALIHAHFAQDGLQMVGLSESLQIPLITTLHGADVTVRRDFASRYGKLWKRASLFICVSDFIRGEAIKAGFPAEKLRVHHIGSDLRKFHVSNAPRTPGLVLFVGRLVEKKGCEVLVRAMQRVQAEVPGASLVVIGDGPLRPALTAIAQELHLSCKFLGPQPPAEVSAWMRKASVFCAPSQRAANGDAEGLGMVFLEAQGSGLPVVSTLHGGIPEAVKQGVTGLLVPEADTHALGDALIEYLTHPELLAKHGAAGPSWVAQDFDLFKQTALLEEIYDEVTSAK